MDLIFEFKATEEAKTNAIKGLVDHCASKNQIKLYFTKPEIVSKGQFYATLRRSFKSTEVAFPEILQPQV